MKQHVRLLSLSAGSSVTLLTIAGTLIVVSIFNESLNWDIFGPRVEAILYGIFGSSIALASVGVAMTFVLGIQEITKAFRAIQRQKTATDQSQSPEATKKRYLLFMFYIILFFALLVASLALINQGVQNHRSEVFRRLVAEQMEQIQPRLLKLIEPIAAPLRQNVSFELYDFLQTLNNLSYVNKATLYFPDPADRSTIWAYDARRSEYKKEDGFIRLFIAKEYEKAIARGIDGDGINLTKLNKETGFIWYHLLKNKEGKAVAVLRIYGNPRENFREYLFGS